MSGVITMLKAEIAMQADDMTVRWLAKGLPVCLVEELYESAKAWDIICTKSLVNRRKYITAYTIKGECISVYGNYDASGDIELDNNGVPVINWEAYKSRVAKMLMVPLGGDDISEWSLEIIVDNPNDVNERNGDEPDHCMHITESTQKPTEESIIEVLNGQNLLTAYFRVTAALAPRK